MLPIDRDQEHNIQKNKIRTTSPNNISKNNTVSDANTIKKTCYYNNNVNLNDDVNFKYLKHVVLKFLTSREYEVIKFLVFI